MACKGVFVYSVELGIFFSGYSELGGGSDEDDKGDVDTIENKHIREF